MWACHHCQGPICIVCPPSAFGTPQILAVTLGRGKKSYLYTCTSRLRGAFVAAAVAGADSATALVAMTREQSRDSRGDAPFLRACIVLSCQCPLISTELLSPSFLPSKIISLFHNSSECARKNSAKQERVDYRHTKSIVACPACLPRHTCLLPAFQQGGLPKML